MERADQGVGQILAALDRQGLAANTLVIFTNDNGGEWLSRNAPLFNRKFSLYEGGIRVPAIMRWPGHVPAGVVTTQVGITMDLSAHDPRGRGRDRAGGREARRHRPAAAARERREAGVAHVVLARRRPPA